MENARRDLRPEEMMAIGELALLHPDLVAFVKEQKRAAAGGSVLRLPVAQPAPAPREPAAPRPLRPRTQKEALELLDRGLIDEHEVRQLLGIKEPASPRHPVLLQDHTPSGVGEAAFRWWPPFFVSRAGWGSVWRLGAVVLGLSIWSSLPSPPLFALLVGVLLLASGRWWAGARGVQGGIWRSAAALLLLLGCFNWVPVVVTIPLVVAVAAVLILDAAWSAMEPAERTSG